MNIKQLFLPLFGALALIGCNNEALEPTSSNTTQANSVTLALSLEGTADASEMRAVSFDANQNVPPTTHDQYSDWTTHCFLRNADGSKKAYAVINWDAMLEGGKVKLKMRGHELNLLPIGSASAELAPENKPVAGERWSIVGITGGGKLNEERTRVDFAPDADLDNNLQPHQARVPFTFEKAYFTVSAASGERAPQISVHFKPQGSLLNIYANNKTAQTVQSELKVITNALSNNGYYDYSTGEAKWVFTYPDVQGETISRPISVANGTGKHYLLWGMPRTASSTDFSSNVVVAGSLTSVEGPSTENLRGRDGSFTNGLAYFMGLDIDAIWSPLSKLVTTGAPNYIVKVMDETTHSFIDPTTYSSASEVYASGIYYKQQDAKNTYGLDQNKPYYLPEIYECRTIFPEKGYHFSDTPTEITSATEMIQFEPGEESSKRKTVNSLYQSVGGALYALRFVDYEDNSIRTAFRYEWVQIQTLGDGTVVNGFKVTTRYLGNDPKYNNSEVPTTPEFWSDADKTLSVIFPALGYKTTAGASSDLGQTGFFWTPSFNGSNPHYVYFFNNYIVASSSGGGQTFLFPLILFKR